MQRCPFLCPPFLHTLPLLPPSSTHYRALFTTTTTTTTTTKLPSQTGNPPHPPPFTFMHQQAFRRRHFFSFFFFPPRDETRRDARMADNDSGALKTEISLNACLFGCFGWVDGMMHVRLDCWIA
ncbi:hypothetical protein BS50DRAFT_401750 [Corynespora cassiicola Philippines]|uniref:Uncharacterized protein n=1 Tax=Corynespora cassiicola Philippines TaxID=1448308 RepID=A0A2T2NKH0_CORCC|nr:hypothetical protein BS50DRAFT_401750 [Corynespora cassiicola Philippines]